LKKIIKPERKVTNFSENNDYEVYNASGANGRSQFLQSPGIPTFYKGEGSLPFIKKLDHSDHQMIKSINEQSSNDLAKTLNEGK
jgi:hypothetical protein